MTVIVPADAKEARKAVFALAEFQGPAWTCACARLATPVFEEDYPFEIGKANVLREGTDAAVFACGLMVNEIAARPRSSSPPEGIDDRRHQRPHHQAHRRRVRHRACAEKCGNVVTVEEHSVIGGLGDAVADVLMGHGRLQASARSV